MALTAAQVAQTFRIIGLPQDGSNTIIPTIDAGWYDVPQPRTTDVSTIVTTLTARLAALSASNLAQMVTLLTREALIQTSQVKTGAYATITSDHIAERAEIKRQIEAILGFRIMNPNHQPRIFR